MMEEEIYCGMGAASSPSKCVNKGRSSSSASNNEAQGFMNKEYFEYMFTSCSPNIEGLVRVSRLLDMFRDLGQSNDSMENTPDSEPVEALKYVLDPTGVDPLISSDQFINCVQDYVCLQSTPSSSDAGSLPGSPQRSFNDVSTDVSHKVSELEFHVRKLNETNSNLTEQLAAAEEEKLLLSAKYIELEKRHAMCDSNNKNHRLVSQELDDVKAMMCNYQITIDDLKTRINTIERENHELVSTSEKTIHETDSLMFQVHQLTAEVFQKDKELERMKISLNVEADSSFLLKEEKRKLAEDYENEATLLQSVISKLSNEKLQLEGKLSEMDGKSQIFASSPLAPQNSSVFNAPSEIEIDDNFNFTGNSLEIFTNLSDSSSSPGRSTNCLACNCSEKNISLQAELKAVGKQLWRPEFIGKDFFYSTIELIRKIKFDFQTKLYTTLKSETGASPNDNLLAIKDEDFPADSIILINKELSDLHEQISSTDILGVCQRPSTCDTFTLNPFNAMLSCSTQTDFGTSEITSVNRNGSKKGMFFLLMLATLLCGLRGVLNLNSVSDSNVQEVGLSSFFFKYGSMIHNDRPII